MFDSLTPKQIDIIKASTAVSFSLIALGIGIHYCSPRPSKEPVEKNYQPKSVSIEGYMHEDYNEDGNVDCIRQWDGSLARIIYKDTSATKGIYIPGSDFYWKPMSPELVKASTDLKDAYNKFLFEKDVQEYKLKQQKE